MDAWKIEWYSAPGTNEVQYVTTSAGEGINEVQTVTSAADVEGLGGYFQLSFGGETTELISWDALGDGEDSVKSALEKLSTVEIGRAHV